MGFFGAIGKILQGKPVFEPDGNTGSATPAPNAEHPQSATPKTIPVVQFGRVECHDKGQQMEVYADIRNDSAEQLLLDKVILLGSMRELDTVLRPGEARQFLIYSGNRTQNAPGGYAEVQYRKDDGDYFSAQHQIRGRQESDGLWDVADFRLQLPIRDLR